MIVVKIELWSALTGKVSEIGRMYIANDASGDAARGNYDVAVCRKGNTHRPMFAGEPTMAGLPAAARHGRVEDYPRRSYNVWRLISRAIRSAFPEEK